MHCMGETPIPQDIDIYCGAGVSPVLPVLGAISELSGLWNVVSSQGNRVNSRVCASVYARQRFKSLANS